jgi:hypothetical protein
MSTDWLIAFPNGDSCSYISSLLRYSSNCCFTGSAMFFDWILQTEESKEVVTDLIGDPTLDHVDLEQCYIQVTTKESTSRDR